VTTRLGRVHQQLLKPDLVRDLVPIVGPPEADDACQVLTLKGRADRTGTAGATHDPALFTVRTPLVRRE
jgi:hypothetical protein